MWSWETFVQLCNCAFDTIIRYIINSLFFSYSNNSIFVQIVNVLHRFVHSDIIWHWHYLNLTLTRSWHYLTLTLTRSWHCLRLTLSYTDIHWVLKFLISENILFSFLFHISFFLRFHFSFWDFIFFRFYFIWYFLSLDMIWLWH